jgi:predicted alpha/beta superfamily hydrolase
MKLDHFSFSSEALGNSRMIRVLYPEDTRRHYPVLYVHDGEFAFRRDTPKDYESMELDLALAKREMIIVSIAAQEWQARTREYSPFPWVNEAEKYLHPGEEEGQLYLEWLIRELMPYVESHYPVKKGRENTFMLGCSLGAVITAYASGAYPNLFSKFGLCSLASWGNEGAFLSFLQKTNIPAKTHYFVRVGSEEGIPRDLTSLGTCYPALAEDFVSLLKQKGITDIDFKLNEGFHHKTIAWSKDMPAFIDFLFKK